MDILQLIEDHFHLTELKWRKKQESIESNAGAKRVHYWDNKELLQWHIDWRDHASIDGEIIMDRMIRTKEGEPAIPVKDGWLTLHDDISEPHRISVDEKKWGVLLAGMLTYGTKSDPHTIAIEPTFTMEDCFARLPYSKKLDEVAHVLEKSYYEAKKRFQLANQLVKQCNNTKRPVLENITSVTQGKQIYNLLFWQTNTAAPEIGYLGIRRFFEQWLNLHGKTGLEALLTNIHGHFSLAKDQGLLLLAECLRPWELYQCLEKLQKVTSTTEAYTAFEEYNQRWEASRQLVDVMSKWLDHNREKVAT